MKKSKLIELINEAFNEVLQEDVTAAVTTKSGTKFTKVKNPSELNPLKSDPNVSSIETTAGQKLKETEQLDEAAKFSIADQTKAQTLIDAISGANKERIQKIVDAINDSPAGSLTGGKIAAALGLNSQGPIYNLLLKMEEAGILSTTNKISLSKKTTPPPPTAPTTPGETPEDEDDDTTELPLSGEAGLFLGGDQDLEKTLSPYFGGEETPEETPEETSVSTSIPSTPASKATDFFLDNERLFQRLINTYTASRMKVREEKTPGDVSSSDMSSAEKSRKERSVAGIDAMIDQFIEKIKAEDEDTQKSIMNMLEKKLASVNASGLYKRISNKVGHTSASTTTPEIVPVSEEDEDFEEENNTLDEIVLNRFRKIANIK
jgi:hypothetical protein